MGARERVLATLGSLVAAGLGLTSCAEAEPACAELVIVHEFPPGELCDMTPTGYFLRTQGGALALGHASASTVVTLASIESPGSGCGALAHDPATGTIWIASPAQDEAPTVLHELGEDGSARGELTLEDEDTGKPMQAHALLVHAGQLYVGGTLIDDEILEGERSRAFLQARDPSGAVDWTHLDYADSHPEEVEDKTAAFNRLDSLVGHEGGVSALAQRWGVGVSYTALLTVGDNGNTLWSRVATPEGVLGPRPKLASDGVRIYLSEERQAVRDADWTTLIDKAREIVSAYSSLGLPLWDSNVSWTDLREVDTTNAARAGGKLFNAMSGANADGERQVWIDHYADYDGELACFSLVAEEGLYAAHALRSLETGELAMLAVAGEPDEHGNAPDEPEPRILIFEAAE